MCAAKRHVRFTPNSARENGHSAACCDHPQCRGLPITFSLNTTASMLSGVFEKLANPLTGCRNIACLVARNSSYYSTNIVDRPESLRTEWRRTYPDGNCTFDRGGRHTVRRSKRRLAVGRRSADIA